MIAPAHMNSGDTGFRRLWLCELSLPFLVRNSDGTGYKIADIGMRGLVKAMWMAGEPFFLSL